MADYSMIVKILRKGYNDGVLRDISSRKDAIRAIIRLIDENKDDIISAAAKDLRRPKAETVISEIAGTKSEAGVMLSNMDNWLKDESVSRSFLSAMDTIYVQRQPLGVVLIIGSWNFPFLLVLHPLIGAIAAGNTVLIKPSEFSPASSELLQRLIPKYLNEEICQVVCTDGEGCAALLASERFDHVFYTGGVNGGRAVYTAASKFLTPVTLELGGKSPSYVDSDVNLMMAAKRIVWSKFWNAGQICLTTDYVLCHVDVLEQFRTTVLSVIREFLGEEPKNSPDFARIIDKKHLKRLTNLLSATKGNIICGGQSDPEDCYLAPTVVDNVLPDDSLMSEELFGPILPIVTVKSASEAVDLILKGEKPLAAYVFTNSSKVFGLFKQNMSSGALLQNMCMSHTLEHNLPFGGVGNSGFGRYHGKFSIDTFSHARAVVLKSTTEFINEKTVYPPYNDSKISNSEWLLSYAETRACSIM